MGKSWVVIRCYLFIVVSVILCFLLCSCKTKYIPVETIREVYVAKTDTFLKKDSVFCHDSVFIHSKGDTVWFEKWHTKYKDRIVYQTRIDSFIKTDSVAIPYPVERKLSRWEQIKMDYGSFALGGTLIAVILLILQLVRWIRRRDI